MSIVSCGFQTTNTISSNAACEIRADAMFQGFDVLEVLVSPVNSVNSIVGFGKPVLGGSYPTTITYGAQEDMAVPNTTIGIATAWTIGPSSPTNFMRRAGIANTIGIFTFPRGLTVPSGNSVVLWNLATNDTFDVVLVWDE